MATNLTALGQFDPQIVEWILDHGIERTLAPNEALLIEGHPAESFHVVLSGLFRVELGECERDAIARLGPGELVGEMSIVEEAPVSASIYAEEESRVLSCPRTVLEDKLSSDAPFAAAFYRGVARVSSARLRERVSELAGLAQRAASGSGPGALAWQSIEASLDQFKQAVNAAERESRGPKGLSPSAEDSVLKEFDGLIATLEEFLGERQNLNEAIRDELGARVQRELMPYLLLSNANRRAYQKPRGYAGDYLTIDLIYENDPSGTGEVGRLIDRCGLDLKCMRAVRNRRNLMSQQVQRAIAGRPRSADDPARILSLACGPAAEVLDTFETLDDPKTLKATLLDIDFEALAFVSNKRDARNLRRQIELVPGNLVYLATGRQVLEIPLQDLAYSIGLIDYFEDPFVINLLDWMFDQLRVGGRAILGNFHVDNPCTATQRYIYDWTLIHRSEADMHRLFEASKFGQPCSEIVYEEEGINLFAIAEKR